jgi:hypothetical protein
VPLLHIAKAYQESRQRSYFKIKIKNITKWHKAARNINKISLLKVTNCRRSLVLIVIFALLNITKVSIKAMMR